MCLIKVHYLRDIEVEETIYWKKTLETGRDIKGHSK